jgi:hypothetical protein
VNLDPVSTPLFDRRGLLLASLAPCSGFKGVCARCSLLHLKDYCLQFLQLRNEYPKGTKQMECRKWGTLLSSLA